MVVFIGLEGAKKKPIENRLIYTLLQSQNPIELFSNVQTVYGSDTSLPPILLF